MKISIVNDGPSAGFDPDTDAASRETDLAHQAMQLYLDAADRTGQCSTIVWRALIGWMGVCRDQETRLRREMNQKLEEKLNAA